MATAPTQGTAKKLEENPALPTDSQRDLVYVLARIFRVIAQVVNPMVAWVAQWSRVSINNSTGNTGFVVQGPTPNGNAYFFADKQGAGTEAGFVGSKEGKNRWFLDVGDTTAETGANAGSDFAIMRYNDAGAFIDRTFAINRATGAAIFYQTLTIVPGSGQAQLFMVSPAKTSGAANSILGYKGGQAPANLRWQVQPGDGNAETGGNVGSNFGIYRYDDNGGTQNLAFQITRSNGAVDVFGRLGASGDMACNGNMIAGGSSTAAAQIVAGTGAGFYLGVQGNFRSVNFSGNLWSLRWNAGNGDLEFIVDGGSGTQTSWINFRADRALVLWLGIAYKPGGGPWLDTNSDARIKKNIEDFTAHEFIDEIRPRYFEYKEGSGLEGKRYLGAIHQEVPPIMKVMAASTKQGEYEFDDMGSIDQTPIVWGLVNYVKQLKARIEALEAAAAVRH